jgi:hypothetical protein
MSAVSDSATGCKPAEVPKALGGLIPVDPEVRTTGSSAVIPFFQGEAVFCTQIVMHTECIMRSLLPCRHINGVVP